MHLLSPSATYTGIERSDTQLLLTSLSARYCKGTF